MKPIFLFWDLENDDLEILDESGDFWFYSEDSVAIAQNEQGGRSWTKLCKIREVHPLNHPKRFELYDPRLNDWVNFYNCKFETFKEICLHAGVEPNAIY